MTMTAPSAKVSLLGSFTEHTESVYTAAFDPTGSRFAAGGGLRAVFIYSTADKKSIGGLADHKQSVYSLVFSKNGKHFVTTGRDGMTLIYDAATFERQQSLLFLKIGAFFLSVSKSASGNETTVLHDADHKLISTHDTSATGVLDAVLTLLYDSPAKSKEELSRAHDAIKSLLPDFDEKRAPVQSQPNYVVRFSPDDAALYIGGTDGVLRIYDAATWSLKSVLPLHSGNIRTIGFSPDGSLVATGSSDRFVKLLDAHTLQPLQTLEGHGDTIFSVSFSPDGKLFATAGKDARLRLWHVEGKTLKPKVKVTAHTFAIKAAVFLGNSRVATVSQDKTIKLWELSTMTCLETIDRMIGGHTFTINSIDVSLNGSYLVTASDDKTVKLWQLS